MAATLWVPSAVLAACFALIVFASSTDAYGLRAEKDSQGAAPDVFRTVKRMYSDDDEACKKKKADFPVLANVMEEVCHLCNELYSHAEINVRARCRANCFSNPMVVKCMSRFSPREIMTADTTFEF